MFVRKLSYPSLAFVAALSLAATAVAVPPDLAARAGQYARRAAQERNALREREEAVEAIPADAEIVDDDSETEVAREAIGTGTRHPVRRAAFEEPASPARRSPRPRPDYAQRASQFGPSGGVRNSYTPAHERMAGRILRGPDRYVNAPMDEVVEEEIPMPMGKKTTSHKGQSHAHAEGQPIYADEYYEEDDMSYGGYGQRQFGRNWGDNCDPCCFQLPRLGYFEAFVGAHGFTGPLNRGTGSFGFQEGFNGGLPIFCGLTMQGGINATQSNFQGAPFTPNDRTQMFGTLGVFRRVDLGFQGGLAVDYLHEDWDYGMDISQLRAELGWKMPCGNELGFWFAVGDEHSSSTAAVPFFGNTSVDFRDGTLDIEPVNIYAFYYRKQFDCGGEGRVFGGATDDSRGLVGGNIRLPINPCWQFTTDFMYVVARDDADFRFNDENWNVSFNLVWTPCGQGWGGCQNYCRPLFDVANNGSFLTRLRQD